MFYARHLWHPYRTQPLVAISSFLAIAGIFSPLALASSQQLPAKICQVGIPGITGVSRLGTAKADWLVGGKDNDYLNGYASSDRLYGGMGGDRLFGGHGNDWLDGGHGNDRLFGGSGSDLLFDRNGNNRFDGGSGRDLLAGGRGEDILIDRDGGDRLLGGSGKDEFWIGHGSFGPTEIIDFQVGRDRLKLLDANISYDKLQLRDRQNRAVITYQGRTLAVLNRVKSERLTRDRFDFGNAKLAQELQTTIDRVVKTSGTPGATAFVTMPDGTTWMGAAGLSNLQARTAMKASDRFNIASITKGFVATVVLQLVREGKLSLNDTLGKWLPSIANSIPNGRQITVLQLLAHTSGINDYFEEGLLRDLAANPSLGLKSWTLQELLSRYIYGKPAKFPPSKGYYYSNTNYFLLGKIIETATHTSLAEQFQSRIFEPLGMTDSFYTNPTQVPGGITHGYVEVNNDGKIDLNVDIDSTRINLLGIQGPAGGIVSTAADLDRFTRTLLDGELLPPGSFKQMVTEAYPGTGIGLGIACGLLPNGEPVLGASGGGLGWAGKIAYLPQSGITVSVLTNAYSLPTEPDRKLLFGIFDAIAKNFPSAPKTP
jgi:D-alanyl-D-alanine carboxypeptidase